MIGSWATSRIATTTGSPASATCRACSARRNLARAVAAERGKTKDCPVVRVNAHALHEAVLREIQRAVEHPTHTAEIIRDAVKALPQPENREAELKAVTRRLREAGQKISRLTAVVESSGNRTAMRPLLSRMEGLEQQRLSLEMERQRLDREIAASRLNRPDVAQVQRLWGRVLELWNAASEAERV